MAVLPAFETNAAGPGKGSSPGNGGPGKGKSAGKGVGSGAAGKAKGQAKGVTKSVAPPADLNTATAPAPSRTAFYRVRHRNGFQETLADGRYLMQDNRGRTIVNRAAKPEDYARLRRLSGS